MSRFELWTTAAVIGLFAWFLYTTRPPGPPGYN